MSKKRRERKRITEGVETKDGEYDQSDDMGAEPDDERDENDTSLEAVEKSPSGRFRRLETWTTQQRYTSVLTRGTVVNGFQKTAGAGIDI